MPRRGHLQQILIGLTVAMAIVAVSPIVFAILGGVGSPVRPTTAFASAPGGNYAVVARPDGDSADTIAVTRIGSADSLIAITRIAHLPGYTPAGAVSPDGSKVALVVTDGGTVALPRASLQVVDLATGEASRIAADVQPLQTPLWTPDNAALIVSRAPAANGGAGPIAVLRVRLDGAESTIETVATASWLDAVGFDREGRLITVVIDGRGSTVRRDGADVQNISSHITRDWKLSPDGSELAFIESNTDQGLRYLARTVRLDSAGFVAQALTADEPALGVAWKPGSERPTFGVEPGATAGGAGAQFLTAAGFDVPVAYSKDGSALAVNHWSGTSFASAGNASLEVVTDTGRAEIADATRFFGWSAR